MGGGVGARGTVYDPRTLRTLSAALTLLLAACQGDLHDRKEVQQTDCAVCHMAEYEATKNPPHEGLFPTTCGDCHTKKDWVPAFGFGEHDWFPLTLGHADRECSSCHTEGYEEGQTPTECVGCHRADYDRSPYPGHNVFPSTCTDCHDTSAWIPSSWSHEWELTGAHVGTECAGCHVGDPAVYDGTPDECVECHRGDYERATTELEGHDLFPTECAECHDTSSWLGRDFAHPWPLDGAHSWTPCSNCHVGDPPVFEGTPTECVDCHRDDYDRSEHPGHNVYPTTCTDCHGTTTWIPSTFMHSFALDGVHAGTACEDCHTGDPPVYEGTSDECIDCHRDDYAYAPMVHEGHETFPTTCLDCHTTASFRGADFTHPWPLNGAHGVAPCSDCHTGTPPRYEGTSRECVDCHRPDYDRSTHPGHDSYPLDCADCHTERNWLPSTFEHDWPLQGLHAFATCQSCHGDPPTYAGTPTDCVSCHRTDYDASPFPGHDSFPTTCADCHNHLGWRPATFVHSWPITGAHTSAVCSDCHTGSPPRYAGTPTNCVGCHRSDYDRAATAVSGHSSYSTTCTDCHSNTAWRPSSFTHPWPLIGAHETTECSGCHTGTPPRYAGTPEDCVDCHRADYDGATFPGHDTYPTTCGDCHTPHTWLGASFTHPFPLTGAHSTTPCESCHTGSPPRYAGTPTHCVDCHRGDYDTSPYPAHYSFDTTCTDCHTNVGWTPATNGNHPDRAFRISSGRHDKPCLDCHDTSLGDWWGGLNTNCTGCHEHDRTREDSRHRGRSGYPTGPAPPNFCLDCHPDGNE
jgi:hypothetical protein